MPRDATSGSTEPLRVIQVVVGYDFSPTADEALRRAVEVACHAPGHVLHVVTAIDPHDGLSIAPTHHVDSGYGARIQRLVTDRVTDMLASHERAGRVQFFVHARIGQAATEILGLAREIAASLIFVGSHGKTDIQRLILGTVSERVVHEAHCSVVVARARESH